MIYLLPLLPDISLTPESPLCRRMLWLHYYYYFNMIQVTCLPIVWRYLLKYWYTLPAFKEREGLHSFSHEKTSPLASFEQRIREKRWISILTHRCERDNRMEKTTIVFLSTGERQKAQKYTISMHVRKRRNNHAYRVIKSSIHSCSDILVRESRHVKMYWQKVGFWRNNRRIIS